MISVEEVCGTIAKKLGSKASRYTLTAEITFDESRAASVKTVGDLVRLAQETAAKSDQDSVDA
ncbi:hypothetical protein [Streptomyces sp. NPDC059816]|uniref:hypothetical protein n=1 Tax=Streptomyces sp. NPDC059816 TaxID=3346960 RepID=UPI003663ABE7